MEIIKNEKISPNFIIIGFPKAGTQWLTALLDAHTEISCFPSLPNAGVKEPHFFCLLSSIEKDGGERLKRELQRRYLGYFQDLAPLFDRINQNDFLALCRKRFSAFCDLQNVSKIVASKTPDTVWHLKWVDRLYPNLKKICIFRSSKDQLTSYWMHKMKQRQRKSKPPLTLTDDWMWAHVAHLKEGYEQLLAYSGSIHILSYESLRTNPAETLKKILFYLGVESNEKILSRMIALADFQRLRRLEQWMGPKNIWQKERRAARLFSFFIGGKAAAAAAYRLGRYYYLFQRKLFNILYDRQLIKRLESYGESHFRKGITGDWKNHLTKEQAEYIDGELSALEQKVFEKYGLT